jgi:hypothetical protein
MARITNCEAPLYYFPASCYFLPHTSKYFPNALFRNIYLCSFLNVRYQALYQYEKSIPNLIKIRLLV